MVSRLWRSLRQWFVQGLLILVIVDSVAALVPKAEIEGDMGDSHVGLHARLMSQALRKLDCSDQQIQLCGIFINQLREKVGVMFGNSGDNNWWTSSEVLCFCTS